MERIEEQNVESDDDDAFGALTSDRSHIRVSASYQVGRRVFAVVVFAFASRIYIYIYI